MGKKRTKKKTPKPQRRSTRNRQKSMKGLEHDEYIQNSQSSPNASTILLGKKDVSLETPIRSVVSETVSDTLSSSQDKVMSTGEKLGPRNLSTPVISSVIPKKIIDDHSDIPSGIDNAPDVVTPINPATKIRKRMLSCPEPLSLQRELEMATPDTSFLQQRTPIHILPKSVMVVDSKCVREIHFAMNEKPPKPDEAFRQNIFINQGRWNWVRTQYLDYSQGKCRF